MRAPPRLVRSQVIDPSAFESYPVLGMPNSAPKLRPVSCVRQPGGRTRYAPRRSSPPAEIRQPVVPRKHARRPPCTLFFCSLRITRELEYANCGHNPPLLIRADGSSRAWPPPPQSSAFSEWHCATRHITLAPADLLFIFTDGVTEAAAASGNDFGEARIVETVQRHLQVSPQQLICTFRKPSRNSAPASSPTISRS